MPAPQPGRTSPTMPKTVEDIISDMYPEQDTLFDMEAAPREDRAIEILSLLQDVWAHMPSHSFASILNDTVLLTGEYLTDLDDTELVRRLTLLLNSLSRTV